MLPRDKMPCEVFSLLSLLFLFGFLTGCVLPLVGPVEPNSSLVFGRIVINNKYSGAFYGALPLGTIDYGIEVEVESRDGSQVFNVTTQEQGYFFIPNVTPNTYYIRRVTFEGSIGSGGREKRGQEVRRLNFTPVPGKVAYFGTLLIDISDRGFATLRDTREDDRAKTYFLQKHGGSPWASREFVAAGPRPTPSMQVVQEKAPQRVEEKPIIRIGLKAEKPEWRVGYQWRYAWKGPQGSGTFTREIIREDTFEGIPSYVMRIGKNDDFVAKEGLGLLGRMSGGRLILKRTAPRQILTWPLVNGKEWRNTFTSENIAEKSSQSLDYRMVVSKVEEVKVPAGAFEAFKIESYSFHSGELVAESWYSPKVKWFVKERVYQQGGLREEELISFKAD